jgi:hypothetical protein
MNLLEHVDAYLKRDHRLGSLDTEGLTARAIEAANLTIAIGRAAGRARGSRNSGVSRSVAPTLGLLVRSTKIYEAIVQQICNRQAELAQLLHRPLLEAVAKAEYLMIRPRSVADDFIVIGYKPEARMIDHLRELARERELAPIETRMLKSARAHLRESGVSQSTLKKRKNWDLDGKSMRAILESLDWPRAYVFGYMTSSHFTHGDWYDLSVHHLRRSGRRYYAQVEFARPTPGHITPASVLFLRLLRRFEQRHRRSATAGLGRRITRLARHFLELDTAWERIRQQTSA